MVSAHVQRPATHAPAAGRRSCAYMRPKFGLLYVTLLVNANEGRAAMGFFPKMRSAPVGAARRFQYYTYFDSLVIASAALPATTQLADPATTASSSNQRNPKASMHSGKSGLMMMYPGITAPGM